MKQRISVEQLNELTKSQKDKLRELWKPTYCDVVVSIGDNRERILGEVVPGNRFIVGFYPYAGLAYNSDLTDLHVCLPLLSIGQLIAMLGHRVRMHFWGVWYVEGESWTEARCDRELVDALWEYVKTVVL